MKLFRESLEKRFGRVAITPMFGATQAEDLFAVFREEGQAKLLGEWKHTKAEAWLSAYQLQIGEPVVVRTHERHEGAK